MKFSIDLSRHETKTVEVFADDRDQAVQRVREAQPGFGVEGLTELGDGDEPGAEHVPIGQCEACSAVIWQGESYATDEEGVAVCHRCIPAAGEPA
jgi:hypothetical protein